jgi:hypothetical protein
MKPTARYTNWDGIQPFLLAVKPPGWQYCLLQRKNKKTQKKKQSLCMGMAFAGMWLWLAGSKSAISLSDSCSCFSVGSFDG